MTDGMSNAEIYGRATGSIGATYIVDRRDLVTGELVTVSSETWTREETTVTEPARYILGSSLTRITVTQPWKTDLPVTRITSGTGQMVGYAQSTGNRFGFRWERQGTVRHHVDKMFLDNVVIYVGDTDQVWGRGVVAVYLVEPVIEPAEVPAEPAPVVEDDRPFMCGTCGFEAVGDRDTRDAEHLTYDGAHYAGWWRDDVPERD